MSEKYEKISAQISQIGIVPVIKLEKTQNAGKLVKALCEGGIPLAEVTFRAAGADETIKAMREECSSMLVGAGTVLSIEQVKKAVAAGAQFIVSPGFNEDVVQYCKSIDVPVFPGCLTPTEIERAMSYGLNVIKFFPSEQFGGIKTIKALSAPYQGIKFMPTGGISLDNLGAYVSEKVIAACGGSFMVKSELLDNEKWDEVTSRCRSAVDIIKSVRSGNNG